MKVHRSAVRTLDFFPSWWYLSRFNVSGGCSSIGQSTGLWPQRLPVQVRSLTLEKVQAYLPAKCNLLASSQLNTFNTFFGLLTLQEISNVGCRCSVCVSSGQRGFVHERLPVDSSLQVHPHPVVLMPQLPPHHTQPVVETADVAFSPEALESRADP